MKLYLAAHNPEGVETPWVCPQAAVAAANAKEAKTIFLRFVRRNGVKANPEEIWVRLSNEKPAEGGPFVTRMAAEKLEPLPFDYATAKHGSLGRDPRETP